MIIRHSGRRSGKTTRLIRAAVMGKAIIVCADDRAVRVILQIARNIGANELRRPMTFKEFTDRRIMEEIRDQNIMIDDLELLLDYLAGRNNLCCATSSAVIMSDFPGKEDEIPDRQKREADILEEIAKQTCGFPVEINAEHLDQKTISDLKSRIPDTSIVNFKVDALDKYKIDQTMTELMYGRPEGISDVPTKDD